MSKLYPFEYYGFAKSLVKTRLNPYYKAYILHEYQAIYFPIAKVASSNLKGHLDLKNSPSLRLRKSDYEKYKHYFKFGFVRNPYDRIVSVYTDKTIRRIDNNFIRRYGHRFYGGMEFKEFVEALTTINPVLYDQHIAAQYANLYEKGNSLLDFVGKYENLGNDLAYVADRIGLPFNKMPEAGNKSRQNSNYQDFYDDETEKIIQTIYARDIETFSYQF